MEGNSISIVCTGTIAPFRICHGRPGAVGDISGMSMPEPELVANGDAGDNSNCRYYRRRFACTYNIDGVLTSSARVLYGLPN